MVAVVEHGVDGLRAAALLALGVAEPLALVAEEAPARVEDQERASALAADGGARLALA